MSRPGSESRAARLPRLILTSGEPAGVGPELCAQIAATREFAAEIVCLGDPDLLASRARAMMEGRLAPSVDDVVALAPAVLRHRMALNFAARAEGVTIDQVIAKLCASFA